MQFRIEKLVQGGVGLSHTPDNKALFIDGTLPGELVEATIVQEKKGYAVAELENIVEASEDRVHPPCPYWGLCGGCDLQYVKEGKQAAYKEQLVLDNLSHLGQVDLQTLQVDSVASGPAWHYRNRVRFHVHPSRKQVGFLGRKTNSLVPIESCPILMPSLDQLFSDPKQLLDTARSLMFANRNAKTGLVEVPAFVGDSDVSLLDKVVKTTVGGHSFLVTANVFFQSNGFLVGELGSYVAEQARGEVVMDLYSGVGTFSAFLSQPGRRLIAVERHKGCLSLAKSNVPSCEYYTDSVENWAKTQYGHVDTVVVDPPRTGLDATVPSLIASWKPQRIVYVSCNSVTLARDLQRLATEGYTAKKVRVFDLYPQTAHQEAVVVFDREEI